jgi:hypothetical protein
MVKMKTSYCLNLLIFLGLAQLASQAQVQYPPQRDQMIQARISGGGGAGKCTFEVVIDGAADVEIRGTEGRLRWRGGGGMSWRRLDCNQPLPRNPNNFRFQGIDGRGSQSLLRSPNSNNGVAVIHVDDPQKGSEGYTGDIMWDGGNDNGGFNGGNRDRDGWNDRDRDHDGWNDRDRERDHDGDRERGDDWRGGGGGNPNVVSNCQNAIRNQLVSQYGGDMIFKGTANTQRDRGSVSVQGFATFRDRRGRTGDIQYNCSMQPNGNVSDVKYNPVGNRRPPWWR